MSKASLKKSEMKKLQKVWGGLSPTLKVGPHRWTVDFIEGLTNSDGSANLFGETDTVNCLINLNPQQAFHQARDTVIHELLHAAFSNGIAFAHRKSRPDEEGVIRSVTPYLLGVIQDNPELVAWLQAEEPA